MKKVLLTSVMLGVILFLAGCQISGEPVEEMNIAKKTQNSAAVLLFAGCITMCGISDIGTMCSCPSDISQSYGDMFCRADANKKGHGNRCWMGTCSCGQSRSCAFDCGPCDSSTFGNSQTVTPSGN